MVVLVALLGFFGMAFTLVSFLVYVFNLAPFSANSALPVAIVLQLLGLVGYLIVYISQITKHGVND